MFHLLWWTHGSQFIVQLNTEDSQCLWDQNIIDLCKASVSLLVEDGLIAVSVCVLSMHITSCNHLRIQQSSVWDCFLRLVFDRVLHKFPVRGIQPRPSCQQSCRPLGQGFLRSRYEIQGIGCRWTSTLWLKASIRHKQIEHLHLSPVSHRRFPISYHIMSISLSALECSQGVVHWNLPVVIVLRTRCLKLVSGVVSANTLCHLDL